MNGFVVHWRSVRVDVRRREVEGRMIVSFPIDFVEGNERKGASKLELEFRVDGVDIARFQGPDICGCLGDCLIFEGKLGPRGTGSG